MADPWEAVRALERRVKALEKATPLANASVGGGRLRFYDGGELLIEGGNLRVTGTGSVSGTFNVSGTLNVTGTTNLDGPVIIDGNTTVNGSLGITGPTVIAGDTDINGTLDVNGVTKITGNTTVSGNLQVNSPGQIKVGSNLTLAPATDGGAILLGAGKINANGTNMVLTAAGGVSIFTSGGNVQVSSTGSLSISNLPTTSDTRVPAGTIKTVGIAGTLYRTINGPA